MKAVPGHNIPIVDGHLDLAENVTIFGRDLTLEVSIIRTKEKRTSNQITVTLPELRKGNVALAFATVTGGFLLEDVGENFEPITAIYHNQKEAEAQAISQIDLYEEWEKKGLIRIIKSVDDLEEHLNLWINDHVTGLVLLMEGADPIVEVRDLPKWWKRGLRMIGLTFGDTKYGAGVGGGTPNSKKGGLTPVGYQLLNSMADLGFIWDISHLSEEGVWQGLELNYPSVCATHANAQALTPTNRHLSDAVIQAIAEKNGVIGLVLSNVFLEPNWKNDKTITVSLDKQLRQHAEYIARLTDWSCVGIGSDLDGGFGLNESPVEINTIADLYKVGDVLPKKARQQVLSSNWLNFLRRSLPKHS